MGNLARRPATYQGRSQQFWGSTWFLINLGAHVTLLLPAKYDVRHFLKKKNWIHSRKMAQAHYKAHSRTTTGPSSEELPKNITTPSKEAAFKPSQDWSGLVANKQLLRYFMLNSNQIDISKIFNLLSFYSNFNK